MDERLTAASGRRAMAAVGVVALALTAAACGGGGTKHAATPASTTTSTTSAAPAAGSATTSPGTATAAAQSTATNLTVTAQVKAQLVAAIAAIHHLQPSDYTGLTPGMTYYAVDHATGDYWAGAQGVPSHSSYQAEVSSQDDGSYLVFSRTPGGTWHAWTTGGSRAPGATCPVSIPADVLAVWRWDPGTCTPPPSAVPTTPASPATAAPDTTPTASFAGWTGREPAVIAFSGDGTNIVSGLAWTWTATQAVGHGTWDFESCDPNCAAGSHVPYPATVTLTDPVGGQFTKGVEQTSGPHAFTYPFTLPNKFINA